MDEFVAPLLKRFILGVVADDVVGALLERLPKVGALVDGVWDGPVAKSGFDCSVCEADGAVVDGVGEGK